MAVQRSKSDPAKDQRRWIGFAKFVFLVMLTVLILMLVQSMVQNHFFSGGALNYRGGR